MDVDNEAAVSPDLVVDAGEPQVESAQGLEVPVRTGQQAMPLSAQQLRDMILSQTTRLNVLSADRDQLARREDENPDAAAPSKDLTNLVEQIHREEHDLRGLHRALEIVEHQVPAQDTGNHREAARKRTLPFPLSAEERASKRVRHVEQQPRAVGQHPLLLPLPLPTVPQRRQTLNLQPMQPLIQAPQGQEAQPRQPQPVQPLGQAPQPTLVPIQQPPLGQAHRYPQPQQLLPPQPQTPQPVQQLQWVQMSGQWVQIPAELMNVPPSQWGQMLPQRRQPPSPADLLPNKGFAGGFFWGGS
jgi:hypothetical protein